MHPDDPADPGVGGDGGEGLGAAGARMGDRESAAPAAIGRELGGDLPCVVCGYNLRGLSIRSVCPECGAGVRATILSVVDPQANVLKPIRFPRLIAGGLLMWSITSLAAALACWMPVAAEVFAGVGGLPDFRLFSGVMIAMAAIGAAIFVRPHAGIPIGFTFASVLAVLLHAPLAWLVLRLQHIGWATTPTGTRLVAMAMVCLAAILLLLRPTARLLVARSLLLRSGRVDRQTLYGMAAAAMVIAVGHAVLWISIDLAVGGHVVLRVLGLVLLLTGGSLLTIGLFGSVVDCVRIAHAIVRPRTTVRDLLRGGTGAATGSRQR